MSIMIHALSTLKGLIKSKKLHIDHWAFRLHYRATVLILFLSCVLVSTKQYAGEPIKCSSGITQESSLIDTYCFVTTTYIVKKALNLTPSEGAPHPGIYPSQNPEDFRQITYYQWLVFILLIQAIFFYFPHWLWKMWEDGEISSLLERDQKFLPKEEQVKVRDIIVEHLRCKWSKSSSYFGKYLVCELLCLANLFGQIALLDAVFFNEYLYYGFEVLAYFNSSPGSMVSPFLRIFPKVTSCIYRYFGSSGKLESQSFLCVLAVNVINEKIFLLLWFWFVFLAFFTIFMLVFKVALFTISSFRISVLSYRFPSTRRDDLQLVIETGNLSNFLFLYLLGENMNESSFSEVMEYFSTVQRGKIN
ncbi:hypothetical protein JTE90_009385 [Oedothorax gibbosus]|uniref:Innexin n=1 Tax=Oedothorax gibbosus TaxID=931172 RepID=A0AAV6VS64_9ARAC|nr:hypothetical protein JTE90_009385 [Oedothorax gibbosus]